MKTATISTVVSALVMFVLYNFAPLQYFAIENIQNLGATITTINGSDTISSSRSVINANFANLNASKAEISDVSGTTTLSSLSSVGTITTGTWNATRIGVPYGGTGWATIASGTIMYGKGTGSIGTTTAGSDGQVLTLVGGTPNWQSGGVNQALDYTWTGFHNFSYGLFATRASSTNATTTNLTVTGNAIFSGSGTTTFAGGISASYIVGAVSTSSAATALPTTDGSTVEVFAYCDSTRRIVAGGYSGLPSANLSAGNGAIHLVTASMPEANNSWRVVVLCTRTGGSGASCNSGNVTVYALCVKP